MRPYMNRHTLAFYLFLITLTLGSNSAHSATITWTNTAGGNWSATNNWSPHQLPTNTDNVMITTPGTYTVTFDLNLNYTPTNVTNLTLGAGGGAAGVQTFVVTNSFNVGSQLLVTNGGVLQSTSGILLAGNLIIDHGGLFNGRFVSFLSGAGITTLTIQNGGVMNTANSNFRNAIIIVTNGVINATGDTFGPVTVANGGLWLANGVSLSRYGFTVAHGGVLDITNGLYLPSLLINSGTINLANSFVNIDNTVVP